MYVGSYAICVLNWNWWLTQDHFLIKHWTPIAAQLGVVGLEYSLVLASRYSTVGKLPLERWSLLGGVRDTNLAWVRPVIGVLSPLCFADHAVKQSVMHVPGFAAASATPRSQWHKTMLGQSHHGMNSYKGRHKQRNRSKRFPMYRLRRPTRLHQNRRRHTQEFAGQGYDG